MPSTEDYRRLLKGITVIFLNWKTSNHKLAEEQNEYRFKWEKSLSESNVSREIFSCERKRRHVVPQIDTRITIRSFEAWIHGPF